MMPVSRCMLHAADDYKETLDGFRHAQRQSRQSQRNDAEGRQQGSRLQAHKSDLSSVDLAGLGAKKKVVVTVPSLDTAVCQMETRKFNEKAFGPRQRRGADRELRPSVCTETIL
jgi:hypothetical protein